MSKQNKTTVLRFGIWWLVFSILMITAVSADNDPKCSAAAAELEMMVPTEDTQAPDFSASDLEGVPHQLSAYRGRVVLVNFWASWCLPCVRELPRLQELAVLLPDKDFVLLTVNVRDRESRVRKLITGKGYDFAVLLDPNGEIYRAFGVRNFPTMVLIDRNGRVIGSVLGERNWTQDSFVACLKTLADIGERGN